MKQLIAFAIVFLLCSLPACGSRTIQGPKGDQGLNGNDGFDGLDGANGASGSNGHNSLLRSMASAPSCPNGGVTFLMGLDLDNDGDLSATEVQQTTYVCNGTNGTNGSNGSNGTNAPPTPFTPVALVDPCGDASGKYDEVFIRLFNGALVASFSDNANGNNTRFSVLTAGSYMTTDGDNCTFTVDANNNIINENHHY